jgi:hypothetical protein
VAGASQAPAVRVRHERVGKAVIDQDRDLELVNDREIVVAALKSGRAIIVS